MFTFALLFQLCHVLCICLLICLLIVVPAEFRNTDEWLFTLCADGLLAFYLGNRGCKVVGIWRHTDTFNLWIHVVFLKNILQQALELNTWRILINGVLRFHLYHLKGTQIIVVKSCFCSLDLHLLFGCYWTEGRMRLSKASTVFDP